MGRLSLALILCCAGLAGADIHAVLVAGSKGWSNYRHQADVAHAYKLLTEGGVAKENVVTFLYDDIASHLTNPFRGKIYNKPANASAEAVDVYAAVKDNIDYKGSHVSPQNFLSVLRGEKPSGGTGRTLRSTAEDDVFVYFADHGGVGSLAFPGFLGMRLLHAKDIIDAIVEAHSKQLYKRLVFMTEACESGSIFDGLLPSNISAYAVTAANAKESSWGWYCDTHTGSDKVMGKTMGVCLGDEFSVRWLEDADMSNRAVETLTDQFSKLKQRVTKSHLQHFGDMSFGSDPLGDYVGERSNATATIYPWNNSPDKCAAPCKDSGDCADPCANCASSGAHKGTCAYPCGRECKGDSDCGNPCGVCSDGVCEAQPLGAAQTEGISSRDAELRMLEWQAAEAERGNPLFNLTVASAALAREVARRENADAVFGKLWGRFHPGDSLETLEYKPPRNFSCLKHATAAVVWNDYNLKYVGVLSNLCEDGHSATSIVEALNAIRV